MSRLADQVGVAVVKEADAVLAELAASATAAEVGKACERIRAYVDPDGAQPDPMATFERRHLTLGRQGSMMAIRGQLDPEAGAALATALDALVRPPTAEDLRTPGQRRADALAELALGALDRGHLPTIGGQRPHLGILITPAALIAGHRPDQHPTLTTHDDPVAVQVVDGHPHRTGPQPVEPVEPGPVEPIDAEPLNIEQVDTEQVETEQVDTEPVETEPVAPAGLVGGAAEPVEAVEAEPAQPKPADVEPVDTKQVESVEAEIVQVGLMDPAAAVAEPAGERAQVAPPVLSRGWPPGGIPILGQPPDDTRTGPPGGLILPGALPLGAPPPGGLTLGASPLVPKPPLPCCQQPTAPRTLGLPDLSGVAEAAATPPDGVAEAAWLEWFGEIPSEIARRIACNSDVWRAVMDPSTGLPLDVGRAYRVAPYWMRKALHARDRGCRWPACTAPTAWVDIHHLDLWCLGGCTSIDKSLCLCRYHHVLVHEGGWQIEFNAHTGEVRVTRPDGTPYELGPSQPFLTPTRRRTA